MASGRPTCEGGRTERDLIHVAGFNLGLVMLLVRRRAETKHQTASIVAVER